MLYLYLMTNKNELTEQLIKDHVEYLKQLDAENKLVLCGPFMIILVVWLFLTQTIMTRLF
ncbi:TPA: YciI family protein [Streptococcus suis]